MRGRSLVPVPAWAGVLAFSALAAVVFLVASGHPMVQAGVQIPAYALAAWLMARLWRRNRVTRPDGLTTLAAVAFGLYFAASIAGVVLPLTASAAAAMPVPSALDVLFLVSYALLAVFLWRLGSRSEGYARRDLLDITIVVGGLAPLCWQLLIRPLTAAGSFTAQLATFLAYPVFVFALLAMTVRLAFIARRRTMPHVLLGCWIMLELVADVVFLREAVTGTYTYGQWWQAMWIVSAGCVGALALHPRAGLLFERQQARTVVSSTRRLYLLSASLAVPIGTIAFVELVNQGDWTILFPAAVGLFLVLLVSLRLSGLMVDNAEQGRVQVNMQRLSEELAFQALHDPLTGLGNRLLFAERADHALAQRLTDTDHAGALLLLDIDDFKTINDTFGHEAGDRVLVEVSRRLELIARHGESAFRLGGDEFAFVLPNARLEDALRLADRIGDALADPFDLGPREIRPAATIGVALADNGQSRSVLLAEADMAMYEGKRRGSSAVSVFDPALHHAAMERHQLERDLRDAASLDQLRVLYQPLVHLASNEIVGVEALLRWEHPRRGIVRPDEFIPIAEANGSIIGIGDWVLTESLRQLAVWDVAHPDRHIKMSVNVSPRQLEDPGFVDRAHRILEESRIDPARVNLEVTEASFGTDAEAMIARLHDLKRLGVTLAIDDFGTEYSSLSHLRRLPVDVLKIDKSFVAGIATEPAGWALTTAIIRLADSLNTTTVAEGIETGGQLAHLRSLNVAVGQGYLFARPMPPEGIDLLLHAEPGQAFASRAAVPDQPRSHTSRVGQAGLEPATQGL